ncbi:hypothetical protein [Oscillibacter ruminantium]|uniref:hypothetical protein n=1 Tax=Oscillibacter ruminantium TaxID=1263547 RepID=UPI0005914C75|nr:hypothetical protein [Oscillibacter ruminantium]
MPKNTSLKRLVFFHGVTIPRHLGIEIFHKREKSASNENQKQFEAKSFALFHKMNAFRYFVLHFAVVCAIM